MRHPTKIRTHPATIPMMGPEESSFCPVARLRYDFRDNPKETEPTIIIKEISVGNTMNFAFIVVRFDLESFQ